MPIRIPFHWLMVSTSPILHRAQGRRGDRKYKKGEAKRDHQDDAFGIGLLPCFGSVCLIKDMSAWAELSCNLSVVSHPVVCSKFLLSRDKNQEREINWPDKSISEFHFLFMSPILPSLILSFIFQFSNLLISLCACDLFTHPFLFLWSRYYFKPIHFLFYSFTKIFLDTYHLPIIMRGHKFTRMTKIISVPEKMRKIKVNN